jgi:hypothetical protein
MTRKSPGDEAVSQKENLVLTRISKIAAVLSALALASTVLADEAGTTTFDISAIGGLLVPIVAVIWLILFTAWGGFRFFY